jgi:NADH-quinone oxidoreductase subunit A
MAAHYDQYIPIVVTILLVCGMMGVVLAVNSMVGPKRRKGVHEEPFECGSPPIGDARQRFSVNFYLVAIFFIVFDIEAVFMYPWAVLYRSFLADPAFALTALVEMFVFIGILSVGLIYVWKRGALEFT